MEISRDRSLNDALERAADLMEEGLYDEALDHLHALDPARLDSDARGARYGLELVCLYALEEDEMAERLFGHLLIQYEDDPQVLLCAGIECSEFQEYGLAEELFYWLAERLPEDYLPAFNLGVVLNRDGRPEEALEWTERAIELNPDFAPSHQQRAHLLQAEGRLDEAAASFRRYLDLEPDNACEWVSLGVVESDRGRYAEAYAAYERALRIDPESLTAYYNLAVTAERAKERDRLAQAVAGLHRIEPREWRTLLAAANLAEVDGDFAKAWDLTGDALNVALLSLGEGEQRDVLPHVLHAALTLAERAGFESEKQALLDRALQLGLYYTPVLDALRLQSGRLSKRARLFSVSVEGVVGHPELLDECRDVDDDPDGSYGYYCLYRVWADDAEEAEARALEFESEHGPGTQLRIAEVEEIAGPEETCRGIFWRGDMHLFRIFADDDEEEEDED